MSGRERFTLKNFPAREDFPYREDFPLYTDAVQKWKAGFEGQLREDALRLLLCRAGGRNNMFEAGQFYQTLLLLGLADSRPGKMFEQERMYQKLVLSCNTEEEAKKKLRELLGEA